MKKEHLVTKTHLSTFIVPLSSNKQTNKQHKRKKTNKPIIYHTQAVKHHKNQNDSIRNFRKCEEQHATESPGRDVTDNPSLCTEMFLLFKVKVKQQEVMPLTVDFGLGGLSHVA